MYKYKAGHFDFIWHALPAVVVFIVLYLVRGNPFEDDAFIYYRYAENLASGYGPVFNIGENVEGYAAQLWPLILAAAHYLSFDLVVFAPVLNLFIGIACLLFVSYLCSFVELSKPRIMAVALSLLCALSYGFYYYGAAGMDTLLSSLVLMFCIVSLYKCMNKGKYLYSLFPLFLLNIARFEGFIFSAVLLLVVAGFVLNEDVNFSKKGLLATAAVFIVLTLALFGFRYSIYHEWLPAPVLTKGFATYSFKRAVLNGDFNAFKDFVRVILSGMRYEAFLLFTGVWVPFIILFKRRSKNDILLWLIGFSIVVNIFVSIWAGGDYFPYKRQFIPVLPILIIFVAWAFDHLFRAVGRGFSYKKVFLSIFTLVVIASWLYIFILPPKAEKNYLGGGVRAELLEEIGSMLRNTHVSTTLLTNMAGKMPYFAGPGVYVRDILGLTDIHNAKYGDSWSFNFDGNGSCGRTDFDYSFNSPFDIFFYNSTNMHNRFISFCQGNTSICENYRFLISDKWPDSYFYIIVNINHPFAEVLIERFDVVSVPISEDLRISSGN